MTPVVEGLTGHYSVVAIDSMADVREIMGGGANALNWLFLSTSGVHGSYSTLDDCFFDPADCPDPEGYDPGAVNDTITVLIVQPRMVRSYYGDITIGPDDVPWLREQVRLTLAAVAKSQSGNT